MKVQSNVAVVIPAFNEKATLRWVVQGVLAHASLVIVVDDGSTDGTADVVADLPVILLRNERNDGKAASLWRGAHEALRRHADAVCTIDGDAQHDPNDMPRLLAAHRDSPASIVIGSRLHSIAAIPRARYRANRIANFWIGWAAGYRIADSQCGFRVYPAWLFQSARVRHDRARVVRLRERDRHRSGSPRGEGNLRTHHRNVRESLPRQSFSSCRRYRPHRPDGGATPARAGPLFARIAAQPRDRPCGSRTVGLRSPRTTS